MIALAGFAKKFLAGPVGIIIVAFFIINGKNSKINDLEETNKAMSDTLNAERVLKAALKDSIFVLGEYAKGVPESIEVKVPYPVEIILPSGDTLESYSGYRCDNPYLVFCDTSEWRHYYEMNCVGSVYFNDSTYWENGLGASVEGVFYYNTGTNENNWIQILPLGIPSTPDCPKKKHRLFFNASVELDNNFEFKKQTIDLGSLIKGSLGVSAGLAFEADKPLTYRFGINYFFWYR